MREAQSHEADDKRRREEAEARNKADAMAYQAEKLVRDAGDKLAAADKSALEEAIKNVRSALERQNHDEVTAASTKLEQEVQRVATAMYQAAGSAPPGGEGPTPGGPTAGAPGGNNKGKGGDVIDAEFEETK